MTTLEITYRACKYCLGDLITDLELVFTGHDLTLKPTLIYVNKEDTLHSKRCSRPEIKPKQTEAKDSGSGLFGG